MMMQLIRGALICVLAAGPVFADSLTYKNKAAFDTALADTGLDVGGENWDGFDQGTTFANNDVVNGIRYQSTAGDSVVTHDAFGGIIEGNRLGRTPYEFFFENDSINFAFAAPVQAFGISFRSLAWRDNTFSITTNTGEFATSGLDYPQDYDYPGKEHFAGLISDVGFSSVT